MTTLVILTFVTISSILIAILVLYAIGKISSIEQATRQMMTPGEQPASKPVASSAPFNGLEGKALWDMLSGKNLPEGVVQGDLESFREQYAPVLLKAIKAAFADGQNDSKFGQPRANPKNDRPIKTLRLSINAWLPSHDVSSLYNAGYDSARAEGDERARLRMTVSEVIGSLFAKLQMPTPGGLVDSLIGESAESSLMSDEAASGDTKPGNE
jgi:hypothetical protein